MRICREMWYPIFVRLLTGLTIGWLSLLSVRGAVAGVMDSEPRPLVVPTPSGPNLRRPEVQTFASGSLEKTMIENGPATRPAIAASAAAHVAPYLRTTDDAAVVADGTRRHDRTEKKVVGRRTFAISIVAGARVWNAIASRRGRRHTPRTSTPGPKVIHHRAGQRKAKQAPLRHGVGPIPLLRQIGLRFCRLRAAF